MLNVLGYPLGEATDALERAGVQVRRIVTTAPPRARAGRGEARVLQQRVEADGGVVLTVAFLDYDEAVGG